MSSFENQRSVDQSIENSHILFRNAPELEIDLDEIYNIGDFYRQKMVQDLTLAIDQNFSQSEVNIIDAACGNGRVLRSIKNLYTGNKQLNLNGFDNDMGSIIQAHQRSIEIEIEFGIYDILEITDLYESNTADIIILTGVLFYFPPAKLDIILNRVCKILKPGGLIYFNLLPFQLFDSPEAMLNKKSKVKWFEIHNPSNGYTDPDPKVLSNYGPYYFIQWNSKGLRSSGNGHPVWYYPKSFIDQEFAKLGIRIQKCEPQFLPETIFQSQYYSKIDPNIRKELLKIPVCDMYLGSKS